jgi:hypothetical protein
MSEREKKSKREREREREREILMKILLNHKVVGQIKSGIYTKVFKNKLGGLDFSL